MHEPQHYTVSFRKKTISYKKYLRDLRFINNSAKITKNGPEMAMEINEGRPYVDPSWTLGRS